MEKTCTKNEKNRCTLILHQTCVGTYLFIYFFETMSITHTQSLDGQNLFHTGHLFDLSHLNNVSPGPHVYTRSN